MFKKFLLLSIYITCLLHVSVCEKLQNGTTTQKLTTANSHSETTVPPVKTFNETVQGNRTGRLAPLPEQQITDRRKLENLLQGNTSIVKYIPRSGESGDGNVTRSDSAKRKGTVSKLGYFPAQADVKDSSTSKHKCSGTLVEDRHVLTSAHCVSKSKPNELAVMAGDISLLPGQASTRETRRVQLVAVHPDYIDDEEMGLEFNIAVLKLDMPFARGNYLHPAVIPSKAVANNTLCFLVGWGSGEGNDTQETTFDLYYTSVYTMDMEQCYKCVGNAICAGRNKTQACIGDEGGPLMCNGVLHGIYIASANNCQTLTGIYTDVVFYKHWIDRIIDWVGDGPMPVPLPYARKRTFTVKKSEPFADSQGFQMSLNEIFKFLPLLLRLISVF